MRAPTDDEKLEDFFAKRSFDRLLDIELCSSRRYGPPEAFIVTRSINGKYHAMHVMSGGGLFACDIADSAAEAFQLLHPHMLRRAEQLTDVYKLPPMRDHSLATVMARLVEAKALFAAAMDAAIDQDRQRKLMEEQCSAG